jgi:hypothetical protein
MGTASIADVKAHLSEPVERASGSGMGSPLDSRLTAAEACIERCVIF